MPLLPSYPHNGLLQALMLPIPVSLIDPLSAFW